MQKGRTWIKEFWNWKKTSKPRSSLCPDGGGLLLWEAKLPPTPTAARPSCLPRPSLSFLLSLRLHKGKVWNPGDWQQECNECPTTSRARVGIQAWIVQGKQLTNNVSWGIFWYLQIRPHVGRRRTKSSGSEEPQEWYAGPQGACPGCLHSPHS